MCFFLLKNETEKKVLWLPDHFFPHRPFSHYLFSCSNIFFFCYTLILCVLVCIEKKILCFNWNITNCFSPFLWFMISYYRQHALVSIYPHTHIQTLNPPKKLEWLIVLVVSKLHNFIFSPLFIPFSPSKINMCYVGVLRCHDIMTTKLHA